LKAAGLGGLGVGVLTLAPSTLNIRNWFADRDSGARISSDYLIYEESGKYKLLNEKGRVELVESNKNKADKVIQYAYDNLQDKGKITIQPGSYTVDNSIEPSSDTLLEGYGAEILVKSENFIDAENVSNITLKGFKLDGNSDEDGYGINILNSEHIHIREIKTRNGFGQAVRIGGCRKSSVESCDIRDTEFYGVSTRGTGSNSEEADTIASDIRIVNNHIVNPHHNNIAAYFSEDITIANNFVKGGGHGLIAITPGRNVTISNNVVRKLDGPTAPLGEGGEGGIEISVKHSRDDFRTEDVTVTGNTVKDAGDWGICVREDGSSDYTPKSITITGNAISGCDSGIRLDECDSVAVTGNTLRNNSTHIAESDDASNTVIENNVERG